MEPIESTDDRWEQIDNKISKLAKDISAKQEAIKNINSNLISLNAELKTERQTLKQLSDLIHDNARKELPNTKKVVPNDSKAKNSGDSFSPNYDEIEAMHKEWAEEDRIAKEDEYCSGITDPAQADYEFYNSDENRTPDGWPDTFYEY